MSSPDELEPPSRGTESPAERRERVAEQLRGIDAMLSHALTVLPGLIRDVRELRAMVEPKPEPDDQDEADGKQEALVDA